MAMSWSTVRSRDPQNSRQREPSLCQPRAWGWGGKDGRWFHAFPSVVSQPITHARSPAQHSFISLPPTDTHPLTHLLTQSLTRSLARSLAPSFTQAHTCSPTRLLRHSQTHIHKHTKQSGYSERGYTVYEALLRHYLRQYETSHLTSQKLTLRCRSFGCTGRRVIIRTSRPTHSTHPLAGARSAPVPISCPQL